jgi:hypothetical protein
VSPVPVVKKSFTSTDEERTFALLSGHSIANKEHIQSYILGILRAPPNCNFAGEALVKAIESFFIHAKQSDEYIRRMFTGPFCAELILSLEPLLLSSKEEWKKQRSSNPDHSSTNRATQSATAILSAIKKS